MYCTRKKYTPHAGIKIVNMIINIILLILN